MILGDKKGKAWGETTLIFKTSSIEVHYLDIKRGGYCSEHKHKKSNMFYIISGKLEISIWDDQTLIDKTILQRGQLTTVAPGLWHMFRALEDTKCIEIYQAAIEEDDIERRTQGGLKR